MPDLPIVLFQKRVVLIPYKLETLDNYLCHSRPEVDDFYEFLLLMGEFKIGGYEICRNDD